MLRKIDNMLLIAYFKVKGLITDLKNDEEGMEIVQVVLLILVGVLAIVGIWGLLDGWLGKLWSQIVGKGQLDDFSGGS